MRAHVSPQLREGWIARRSLEEQAEPIKHALLPNAAVQRSGRREAELLLHRGDRFLVQM